MVKLFFRQLLVLSISLGIGYTQTTLLINNGVNVSSVSTVPSVNGTESTPLVGNGTVVNLVTYRINLGDLNSNETDLVIGWDDLGNLSWANITNETHHAFDNFPADIMPEWVI